MNINPIHAIDAYKSGHIYQYPKNTTLVYSNLTARSAKLCNIPPELFTGSTVFFGLQYFIKHFLIEQFDKEFFSQPKQLVLNKYKRRMDNALGEGAVSVDHIAALHDLGYLPICIRALPEGTCVPLKVPSMTIHNTIAEFYWLTNYLETVLSSYMWLPITSATTAHHYRLLLDRAAKRTGVADGFTKFQGHDFSARGMCLPSAAALSGAGHLLSFVGTDTFLAIDFLEDYYYANSDKETVGCSVPATEHSVMCMGSKEGEIETIRRLITETYPKGIVSIVADTWDFWKVVTEYATALKDEIMARDGKVVFRPDSGDPVKVICGSVWPSCTGVTLEERGAVQCLYDIFGGTVTNTGHKVLDSHVGLIYGDSITIQRATAITEGLESNGFASSNIVLGIGSYTYQYVTRDTYGMAVKSTFGRIGFEPQMIYKDPATDTDKFKKSLCGIIEVKRDAAGKLYCNDGLTQLPHDDLLRTVFCDGVLLVNDSLWEIRARLSGEREAALNGEAQTVNA